MAGEIKNKAISASNKVEVEAELGNKELPCVTDPDQGQCNSVRERYHVLQSEGPH